MRIAICDDEKRQIELISACVRSWARKRGETIAISTFSSAAEFFFHWTDNKTTDLLFLDIEMNSMSGMELAHLIRKSDDKLIIVFITGYTDYVFQGYDVQALHYLIKPIKESEFFLCLDRSLELIKQRNAETFIIPLEGQSYRFFYSEIYMFESVDHYISMRSSKGTFTFKKKMDDLVTMLPLDRFYRCHRSYIVNMHYVNTVNKTEAFLDNGIWVPVSKSKWNGMNEAFLKYYTKGLKV